MERVLVVPTKVIENLVDNESGIFPIDLELLRDSIERFGFFIDRNVAEFDEANRQVIPYVLMNQEGRFLLLRRTNKQQEKRLHGRLSIGVGGHITLQDGDTPWKAFLNGMEREIHEEVDAKIRKMVYLGLLNDLSSPVSRVHVGIVYLAEVEFRSLNEPDMFEWWFKSLEEITQWEEELEGWSKLTLDFLRGLTRN
ncbi:NUDIX domain-containing protein [Pseudothermotoga sp.]|nr:NUDIX domain-containing protein [Pseudothermotoga sp.]MCX7813014.1 NUDIX domain-containing protein [Pseudothermotoga sp.]MDW8139747.1 NUDIX domain-containing protein [Pseudothermotoga sp.]